MMSGMGMGLVILMGVIVAVVAVGRFALSQKPCEATTKRKNDEFNSDYEGFTIGDDGEIVEFPETKFKRRR
ncbi:MAG: hypothetical protein GC179_24630 [Anaerolineaceae bacterium]|nr:hypothetical protein [Anaerolineaceae bacterium]